MIEPRVRPQLSVSRVGPLAPHPTRRKRTARTRRKNHLPKPSDAALLCSGRAQIWRFISLNLLIFKPILSRTDTPLQMSDPVHFYSPLRSADALLPRSGTINWAERRHHAIGTGAEQSRLGVVIFWAIVAALLLARVMLVGADAPQADAAGARSAPTTQTAASPPARI
ncbi:MAG: hypothetical protein J0G28_05625 [Afipia sp.]|nr:hypothetical protein [Afipia sp.]